MTRCAASARAIACARRGILQRDLVLAFAARLARFFVRSEDLRQTTHGAEYLRCIADEARCAAEMTLLVVPVASESRFARFFHVLAVVANLVDKLHDVRGDFARGEIRVRPGIALHLRLLAAFAQLPGVHRSL